MNKINLYKLMTGNNWYNLYKKIYAIYESNFVVRNRSMYLVNHSCELKYVVHARHRAWKGWWKLMENRVNLISVASFNELTSRESRGRVVGNFMVNFTPSSYGFKDYNNWWLLMRYFSSFALSRGREPKSTPLSCLFWSSYLCAQEFSMNVHSG